MSHRITKLDEIRYSDTETLLNTDRLTATARLFASAKALVQKTVVLSILPYQNPKQDLTITKMICIKVPVPYHTYIQASIQFRQPHLNQIHSNIVQYSIHVASADSVMVTQ